MRVDCANNIQRTRYNYHSNRDVKSSNPFIIDNSKFISGNNYMFFQKGNVTQIITFLGNKFSDEPIEDGIPKLKMKVAAVSRFQDSIKEINEKDARRYNKINYQFDRNKKEIKLYYEKTGKQIGFIHYEILDYLYDEMEKHPEDFEIELASIIKFPKINNIGLKARINYVGEDKKKFNELFDTITDDVECKPITYPPIKPESPESILKTILKYEEQINGTQSKADMSQIIENIANEIKNDKNKNILLLGHRAPDGDCIGSLLGMKNAIELMGKNKNIDCSIDDRIPQLFDFLPGIKQIKLPDKNNLLKALNTKIETLRENNTNNNELKTLQKVRNNLAINTRTLQKGKIYDLVILMDVASPERLGNKYAEFIDPYKTKIIFIDHHPKRFSEWNKSKNITNIDIEKVNNNHLAWVADRVPAAAEMVSVIAGKLNPKINNENAHDLYSVKERNILKHMATALLTGVHTDTSSYSRSANLYSEDMLLPKYERPKYDPIGMAKWFSKITNRTITRNFIESNLDNQEYKMKNIKTYIRETLPKKAVRNDELQLGYVQIEKEYIDKLWIEAAKDNPEITFKDIMGVIKYSSAFKALKRPIIKPEAKDKNAKNDSIAYLITQSEIKGELNSDCNISNQDMLTFSFRSQTGTNHAAILASLFDGGGHGAAAGGRIKGTNIDFNTKLLVQINDNIETEPSAILKVLNKNFKIEHSAMTEEEKNKNLKHVKVIKSPIADEGRTANELITDVVREIRKNQALENLEPIQEPKLSLIA